MDEIQRQHTRKKLDDFARQFDTVGDPNLGELFSLLEQAVNNPNLQPEQVVENLSLAAENLQAALPDLSGLADVPEAAQSLLGLVGELLSGLGDS
jgi:hypothetical protein